MKVLFAVISYQGDADNGNNQLIRETWGKDVSTSWFPLVTQATYDSSSVVEARSSRPNQTKFLLISKRAAPVNTGGGNHTRIAVRIFGKFKFGLCSNGLLTEAMISRTCAAPTRLLFLAN